MGIVRFALRFPYTFYVLAALILFLGVSAITVMPEDIFPQIESGDQSGTLRLIPGNTLLDRKRTFAPDPHCQKFID